MQFVVSPTLLDGTEKYMDLVKLFAVAALAIEWEMHREVNKLCKTSVWLGRTPPSMTSASAKTVSRIGPGGPARQRPTHQRKPEARGDVTPLHSSSRYLLRTQSHARVRICPMNGSDPKSQAESTSEERFQLPPKPETLLQMKAREANTRETNTPQRCLFTESPSYASTSSFMSLS